MIDPAVLESRNARARAWFDALRDRIVAAFEQLEVDAPADLFPGEPAKFELKPWVREAGGVVPEMYDAFRTLVRYSISRGAEGIVFTCSAFRDVIDACAKEFPIPMIGPNVAMIEQALDAGSKFAVMATVGPTIPSFSAEMLDVAAARGRKIELVPYVVDGAFDALAGGDPAQHDALVAARAREIAGCDAIVLAQFTLSRAVPAVAGVSVMAAPRRTDWVAPS